MDFKLEKKYFKYFWCLYSCKNYQTNEIITNIKKTSRIWRELASFGSESNKTWLNYRLNSVISMLLIILQAIFFLFQKRGFTVTH